MAAASRRTGRSSTARWPKARQPPRDGSGWPLSDGSRARRVITVSRRQSGTARSSRSGQTAATCASTPVASGRRLRLTYFPGTDHLFVTMNQQDNLGALTPGTRSGSSGKARSGDFRPATDRVDPPAPEFPSRSRCSTSTQPSGAWRSRPASSAPASAHRRLWLSGTWERSSELPSRRPALAIGARSRRFWRVSATRSRLRSARAIPARRDWATGKIYRIAPVSQ